MDSLTKLTSPQAFVNRRDPNRADDPEYIVRLVGQVVRVSMETVRIVNALPKGYT